MLKIIAIGNLTNDVELRSHEDGKPYAILRIASDRRYRDREGNKLTDFISIKVRGALAERCAAFAYKGCKLAASGDFETIPFWAPMGAQRSGSHGERRSSEMSELSPQAEAKDMELATTKDPGRQPGFLIKANEVEFLSPRKVEEAAETQTATQRSGCGLERRSGEVSELSASAGSEGYEARDDETAAIKSRGCSAKPLNGPSC